MEGWNGGVLGQGEVSPGRCRLGKGWGQQKRLLLFCPSLLTSMPMIELVQTHRASWALHRTEKIS